MRARLLWLAVLTLAMMLAPRARDIAAGAGDEASAQGPDAARILRVAPPERASMSGFLLEGPIELEFGFGDAITLGAHVDRFYALRERMNGLRRAVSRHAATVLGALPASGRYCPADVAVPYYRLQRAGELYEELGAELEASYRVVRELEELGESDGLTPDYRWKLEQAHAAYEEILVDAAEMRAAIGSHLQRELRFRRCQLAALLRQGAAQAPGEISVTAPLAALRATFFVDNRGCTGSFQLYLDDVLLGTVPAGEKVAFQAEAGSHHLCLIDPRAEASCGEPGTVRVAHVYEGWSMTTHCR